MLLILVRFVAITIFQTSGHPSEEARQGAFELLFDGGGTGVGVGASGLLGVGAASGTAISGTPDSSMGTAAASISSSQGS